MMKQKTEQQKKDLSQNKENYNLKHFPETEYKTFSESWFNECFKIGCKANNKQKSISKEIVKKYKINGICDPCYIANLISLYPDWVKRLFYCYSSSINKVHNEKQYLKFIKGVC